MSYTYRVGQMRPPTAHIRHSRVRGVVGGANPLIHPRHYHR